MAAIINLAVNIALIRYIGLYAASISSVVAYGVLFLFRFFDIQKIMKISIRLRVFLSVAAVMIIDFAVYYIRINWLSFLNLCAVALFSLYLNRKIVKELVGFVRNKMKK